LKASKVLGGLISIVSILGMVAFAMGIQSMFSVIQTGIPGGEGQLEMNPAEPVIIPLTPTNTGYLDASLEVSVEFVIDDEVVASDEISLDIPGGTQVPTQLELNVPETVLLEWTEESVFQVVTHIKVTSLFDYISFDNLMTIDGGAQ
jgi:hypothetical protein